MNHFKNSKVIVISNFHENAATSRSNLAYKYFRENYSNVEVLYCNYSHSLKSFRKIKDNNCVSLNTIRYVESLSLKRILSHFIYCMRVFVHLLRNDTDIIYLNVPPNLLCLIPILNINNKRKIILDIIDLWPESFPHKNRKHIKITIKLVSYITGYIRNIAISKSHYVIAESNYFYKYLGLKKYKSKSKVIYLKKFSIAKNTGDNLSGTLSIGYLGNIGVIYDFQSLIKILYSVGKKRKVKLHIIGGGPKSQGFLNELNNYKINYRNHGVSFDENMKEKILSKCWFGFNGYEKTTQVALSYKFIDYMSFGLPVINYCKEDTYNFVEKNKVGINYDPLDLKKSIQYVTDINKSEILSLKNNAFALFKSKFSGKSYFHEMDEVIRELN